MGEFYDLAQHPGGESPAAPCYAPLRWSAEKPKRRGWWWVDESGDPDIVWVREDKHGGWVVFCVWGGKRSLNELKGARWAGPLVEPPDEPIVEPEHNIGVKP